MYVHTPIKLSETRRIWNLCFCAKWCGTQRWVLNLGPKSEPWKWGFLPTCLSLLEERDKNKLLGGVWASLPQTAESCLPGAASIRWKELPRLCWGFSCFASVLVQLLNLWALSSLEKPCPFPSWCLAWREQWIYVLTACLLLSCIYLEIFSLITDTMPSWRQSPKLIWPKSSGWL